MPNDRLLEISDRGISMLEAFATADQVLLAGVQGITDLITTPGLINLDFADVKSVMQGAGSALMGIGSSRGADRAIKAAELASRVRCSRRRSTARTACCSRSRAARTSASSRSTTPRASCRRPCTPEANIIFGAVIDDTLGDEVRVTVIAAGFDGGEPRLEAGRGAAHELRARRRRRGVGRRSAARAERRPPTAISEIDIDELVETANWGEARPRPPTRSSPTPPSATTATTSTSPTSSSEP